ncbi:HTH domain-containing protein [Haloplanus natans]|uniref:HTH domain-containing protein n=1 Tax=Haloplanus natans TaxID=376171 RepID=UPI00067795C5|nr:HTH domain-containing protein [Haloplanus natans]
MDGDVAVHDVFQPLVITLAVYAGTHVWGLFPCDIDGERVTVDDCLDAFLQRRSPVEPLSPG